MVFTASLFRTWHSRDILENKPASFLVVFLGKALNGTLRPLCGRQVAQTPRKWQPQTSADIPFKRQRYNLLSREWRINNQHQKMEIFTKKIASSGPQITKPWDKFPKVVIMIWFSAAIQYFQKSLRKVVRNSNLSYAVSICMEIVNRAAGVTLLFL